MPLMRMRIVLLLLIVASSLHAAEVVDNAAVVRMVRAGLSIDVVMTKIAQSQTTFDTSVDALITLKGEGVPDPVIKAMLVKAPAEQATPTAPVAAVQPKPPTDSLCVHVQYYTLEGNGWSWKPSLLCANGTGVDIDEQSIPFSRVAAHCFVLSALPRNDHEWWLSDGTEVHKFRARDNELQSMSDFIARVRGRIPHGSCADRSLRKLLPAAAQDGSPQ
jgi:hypothetical protein